MSGDLSSKNYIETQFWIFKATGSANKQYNWRIKMIHTHQKNIKMLKKIIQTL